MNFRSCHTITFLLFCPVLLLAQTTRYGTEANEERLVRQTFNNYKAAILNDKGEEAASYVDNNTIAYYSGILEISKNADSIEVNNLSLFDKLMVFTIRHRTTKQEIMKMDGKGLFVHAVKQGMVGKSSVSNNNIGDITIDKNSAKGQLVLNGQTAPLFFEFNKENGFWKLDLVSLFPMTNVAFKNMVTSSGENENDYLFMLLEMLTGKRPGNEIWHPLK